MVEILVLAKASVLETFDGPEMPEREYTVPVARLAECNRECETLRRELAEARRNFRVVR